MSTGLIEFFVEGEPCPMPKEQAASRIVGWEGPYKPILQSYSYYRAPAKGALEGGRNWKAWQKKITVMAQAEMLHQALKPFGPDAAVVAVFCVYRTIPKSYLRKTLPPTKPQPNMKPDVDNLAYLPTNCLTGVCYHDDAQIITKIEHKRWATEKQPAGITVRLFDYFEHAEYLEEPCIILP